MDGGASLQAAGEVDGVRVGLTVGLGEPGGEQREGAGDGVGPPQPALQPHDVAVDHLVVGVEGPGDLEEVKGALRIVGNQRSREGGGGVDRVTADGFAGDIDPRIRRALGEFPAVGVDDELVGGEAFLLGARAAAGGHRGVEAPVVDLNEVRVEREAAVAVVDDVADLVPGDLGEGPAEPGQGGVQGVGGALRRAVGPQRGRDRVAGGTVGVQGQVDEQLPGPGLQAPGDLLLPRAVGALRVAGTPQDAGWPEDRDPDRASSGLRGRWGWPAVSGGRVERGDGGLWRPGGRPVDQVVGRGGPDLHLALRHGATGFGPDRGSLGAAVIPVGRGGDGCGVAQQVHDVVGGVEIQDE